MVRTYHNRVNDSSLGMFEQNTPRRRRERNKSIDYDEVLNQKRKEEHSYRHSDPFVGSNLRASTSEGYLSSNAYQDDYGLTDGLSELSGTLAKLQNTATTMDDTFRLPRGADRNDYRDAFSAPTNPLDSFDEPKREAQPKAGRRGKEPMTKSGYRRELQEQMEEQRIRKEREKAEIRAEKYGGHFEDPMQQLRYDKGRNSRGHSSSRYSPSVYDGSGPPRLGRRGGGNAPPPASDKAAYQRELERQIAEQAERKEREKREEKLDWWEKRPMNVQEQESPKKKPHPSQRSDQHPRKDRKSYEDELKDQMERRKKELEEAKRKEKEEEEKLERRIQEQQAKMKAEYEEELAKRRAKEEAKLKRQEDMMRKQQEMQESVEKSKQEAAEKRQKERNRAAKEANRVAREEGTDEQEEQFRSSSPPVPSMRGSRGEGGGGVVANQLSSMREQLEKKQEEHNGVWNGLVEV